MYTPDVAALIRRDDVESLKRISPLHIVRGDPILHYCVHQRALRCVEWLLSRPENDVNELDSRGYPAICYALCGDNFIIFYLLLENGARIDYADHRNVFRKLLSNKGNPACLRYLLLRITKKAKIHSGDNQLLKGIVFNELVHKIKNFHQLDYITVDCFQKYLFGPSKELKKFLKLLMEGQPASIPDDNNAAHLKRIAHNALISKICYYPDSGRKLRKHQYIWNLEDFEAHI